MQSGALNAISRYSCFPKSEEFYDDIPIGARYAIHRWRYARVLEVKGRKPGRAKTEDALQAILESSREIISGGISYVSISLTAVGATQVLG